MEDWQAELERGDADAAWDSLVSRYRRVIFAAIRHYAHDYDDVMDVFARVCDVLREDDLRRLRAYHAEPGHHARFSTWLVTVARHITVDWFRRRDGRRRLPALVESLPPRQRRVFECVFLDGRSHIEAYELILARDAPELTFGEFVADLNAAYKAVGAGRRGSLLRELHPSMLAEEPPDEAGVLERAERRALLEQALSSLPPQDRAAVELYVMEELPAADVARIVGLPTAKAVYNRVYRALATMREHFTEAGIQREDL